MPVLVFGEQLLSIAPCFEENAPWLDKSDPPQFWESWAVDPSGFQVLKLVDSGRLSDDDQVRKGRWVNQLKAGRTEYVVTAHAAEIDQIGRRLGTADAFFDASSDARAAEIGQRMQIGDTKFPVRRRVTGMAVLGWAVLVALAVAGLGGVYLALSSR